MNTVPNKKGAGEKSPRAASTKKQNDPRNVVRFEDYPGTGIAGVPLKPRPALAGGYDIHQAAERYKLTVRELWQVWSAAWGDTCPDTPSPEGCGSTRPTSAGRSIVVPEPILSVMRLALDLEQLIARVALFKEAAAQMGVRFTESKDAENALQDAVAEIRTSYVQAVFADEPNDGQMLLGRIAAGEVTDRSELSPLGNDIDRPQDQA